MGKMKRRSVVKAIWVTPIVYSVLLPVHAQTTCGGLESIDVVDDKGEVVDIVAGECDL